MRLPHWMGCRWTNWKMERVETLSSYGATFWFDVQYRTCTVCNYRQELRLT